MVLESSANTRESSDDNNCEIAAVLGALLAASLIILVLSIITNGLQFIWRKRARLYYCCSLINITMHMYS